MRCMVVGVCKGDLAGGKEVVNSDRAWQRAVLVREVGPETVYAHAR